MRLPGGQKNLLTFGVVGAAAFVVTLYVIPGDPKSQGIVDSELSTADDLGEPATVDQLPGEVPPAPESPPPPVDGLTEPAADSASVESFRSYSLPLVELPGLPPDVTSGTRVEVWVAWEPPITEKPRVQRLFGGAQVVRLIPPTVAEAPTTVELLVPAKEFPELLFADRHGSLSAAVVPP
ncbi:MAG TPA: hypothetical protein VEV82_07345 [Actinomycetota bacterium]|nr:hypothetical protein [Actinomycetota bacterium]